MASYLSKDGLIYFWNKIKNVFVTKDEFDELVVFATNNDIDDMLTEVGFIGSANTADNAIVGTAVAG